MASKNITDSCTCPTCPSFAKCDEETGFCFQPSISNCIMQQKGCICGACPVTFQYGLKNMYYCTRGNEKKQSKQRI